MCGTTFPLTQWLFRPFEAAYSCGAVADFHRLPDHPVALVQNQSRTRLRDDSRRALAPTGQQPGFTVINPRRRQVKTGKGRPSVSDWLLPSPATRSRRAAVGRNRACCPTSREINSPSQQPGIYSLRTPALSCFLPRFYGRSFHRRWNQAQSAHRRR